VAALDQVYERIAAENLAAARRVFRRLIDATRRVEEFPTSCPAGRIEGTRELMSLGLPYAIVYRVSPNRVDILRVFHTTKSYYQLMN
jgi:plasmid stabilization system protein ParE